MTDKPLSLEALLDEAYLFLPARFSKTPTQTQKASPSLSVKPPLPVLQTDSSVSLIIQ